MNIVIIGDGKVGHKLAVQLTAECYDVTLIDVREGRLKDSINELDVSCVVGDGASAEIQMEADVQNADLVIACASTDEPCAQSCILSADSFI